MDLKNRAELTKMTYGYSASLKQSLWQLGNTFLPFFGLIYLSFFVFNYSHLLSIPFGVLLGLFYVRIFCLQHDCGHGSLFRSKKMNNLVGIFCSLVTAIPYHYWRYYHAQHHINSGKLEKRGIAEFNLLTKKEYLNLNKLDRLKYRIQRHAFCFFVIAPFYFILSNQIPYISPQYTKNAKSAMLSSIIAISLYAVLFSFTGVFFVLFVYIPAIYIATVIGTWLFYIQHNFENSYFQTHQNWSFGEASLLGSSYCSMPKILEWFTACIGYHHIHHLNPNIPNYYLAACHRNNPFFGEVAKTFTIFSSWKTLSANLWDSEQDKVISFREAKDIIKT